MSSSTSVAGSAEPGDPFDSFCARRRRLGVSIARTGWSIAAQKRCGEMGARHHAVAVGRARVEPGGGRRSGGRRICRDRSDHGVERVDLFGGASPRPPEPVDDDDADRTHRRPHGRAPRARSVRLRRASTRSAAVRSLRQRPARDRHRTHRVVVARARGRRRAVTRKIGDDPVGWRGCTPRAPPSGSPRSWRSTTVMVRPRRRTCGSRSSSLRDPRGARSGRCRAPSRDAPATTRRARSLAQA